jgi:hypothetical protein
VRIRKSQGEGIRLLGPKQGRIEPWMIAEAGKPSLCGTRPERPISQAMQVSDRAP